MTKMMTEARQLPMLMNPEMVIAVMTCAGCGKVTLEIKCPDCGSVERRKSQTRRVAKPQPTMPNGPAVAAGVYADWHDNFAEMAFWLTWRPPYAKGDLVYMREAWRTEKRFDRWPPRDLPGYATIEYLAEAPVPSYALWQPGKYRPGMFLPKRFARIWCKITDVRAERVQDITEEDCIAEGIPASNMWAVYARFMDLWDSLNKKRGYGWDANPAVFAYGLQRVEKPVGTAAERG